MATLVWRCCVSGQHQQYWLQPAISVLASKPKKIQIKPTCCIIPVEWGCKCICLTTTGCIQVVPWPDCKGTSPLSPQQTVGMLNPIRKTWDLANVTNKASTPISYNILIAQGTAYRRNRRNLRDTQVKWKEQSSNDGINGDLEDDRCNPTTRIASGNQPHATRWSKATHSSDQTTK